MAVIQGDRQYFFLTCARLLPPIETSIKICEAWNFYYSLITGRDGKGSQVKYGNRHKIKGDNVKRLMTVGES